MVMDYLYYMHDWRHAVFTPARLSAGMLRKAFNNPINPVTQTKYGRTLAAGAELFERLTRRFERPVFGLETTTIGGKTVKITEEFIDERPFGNLLHFARDTDRNDPQVLVVAPMSGHYATLLRGTVEALLPHHDVYITDWEDARVVPRSDGRFNLDDFIDYLRHYMTLLGPDVHVIAVCQPSVPVMAAVSLMNAENHPHTPRTMTLMGGPVDARVCPT